MLPPGVSSSTFAAALAAFKEAVGEDHVYTSDEDVALYRDAYDVQWGLPGERHVSAAVAPTTVEQVQKVVVAANRYRIPIYPVATGMNLGYGGSAPNYSGSVVLDLKLMNRVIEVDDKRHFAIVEPGVTYFDFYRHVQDQGLKVWIDCPDPGWGSPIGNALDHGVGYTYMGYRDHFYAHCGMEVVLPNGEIMRTGMGALPGAKTWGEYHYGVGPYVDGLFSQSNFGVVTKMGFHMFPQPEAYRSGTVFVPRRLDLIPLIAEVNALEHAGTIGQPNYGTPLRAIAQQPAARAVLEKAGGPTDAEFDALAKDHRLPAWSCGLQFYGAPRIIDAAWEYAKERLAAAIPGATFKEDDYYHFPMSHEQQLQVPHKPSVGIPNLELFRSRTPGNPVPSEGHVWFSPVIPKSGEAVLEAQRVFGDASRGVDVPTLFGRGQPYGPLSLPSTWMYRAFVFITGWPISRSNPAQNQRVYDALLRLVHVGAEHGWGEYRTPPAFQQEVVQTYSFNNHVLQRFHATLKDAIDPNGIISAGRYGIWPKHLRKNEREG
jgi:4-cresol dehydrogenase (hydroxylating)